MTTLDVAQVLAYLRKETPYAGCKGSVVRLSVTDFMTYHSVEFWARPNVNVILGPNGTGKSTIVCALCLGLGGKPKILGRASALKEFIRHGAKSATIEIELYNPDGLNYVIKRHISENNKSAGSQWYFQKKKVKQEKIEAITASLNIQLDNLCQFLPQDRVQDFVVMDSAALLLNTQKALGNDDLFQRHDRLIQQTVKLREFNENVKFQSTKIKSLQQYTKRLEKDVENHKEREGLKAKVSELEIKKAWVIYMRYRDLFISLSKELEKATNLKKKEEEKFAPLKKSVDELKNSLGKLQVDFDKLRSHNNSLMNGIKRKIEDEFDKLEVNIGEEQAKFNELNRSEFERQKRIENVRKIMMNYEQQIEEIRMRGDFDDARLNGEVASLTSQIQKMGEQILEINEHEERSTSQRRYNLNKIRSAERDLQKIDDLRVSRMKFLEREQPAVYDCVKYYEDPNNRQRFNGEIHEPMILHISVNDLKYARAAEKQIGLGDLTCFFCEDKNDVEIMLKINDERKKRVSVVHFSGPRGGTFRRPTCQYDQKFMRRYGFQKALLDVLEGPDYYMGYLHERSNLHIVLLGNLETEKKCQEIMNETELKLFLTEGSSYIIQKSNYSSSKSLIIDSLRPAYVMTTEVNKNEKEKLIETLNKLRQEDKQLEEQIASKNSKKAELEDKRQTAENKIQEINERIGLRTNLQQKLEKVTKQLHAYESETRDMTALKRELDDNVLKHRKKLLNVANFLSKEIPKIKTSGGKPTIIRKKINLMQARKERRENELELMQTALKDCDEKIKTVKPKVEEAAKNAEFFKKEALTKSKLKSVPNDIGNIKETEKDIDKELSQTNVLLNMLIDTDPTVLQDYQEQMQKLTDLQQQKENGEKQLNDIKEEIQKGKEDWLVPLNELIGTVNRNFGRFFASMGCAGEVKLFQPSDENDFSKYGIKIFVKFRASEPLSELGGSKGLSLQSGGEKVISTALYILALQELTTVPFRVIDEINQGMDATNEARFFNFLCSLAKGPNTPQYFLLSPKMLPAVEYPDTVGLHFIYSGPHVKVATAKPRHTNADSSDDDGESD